MSATTLSIDLRSSRIRQGLVFLTHGLAGASVWAAELAPVLAGGLALMIAISLVIALKQRRPSLLRCRSDGGLEIRFEDAWEAVEIRPATVVLASLVVLRFRRAGRRWDEALAIYPDSLAADAFRRLRVWLRWRAVLGTPEPGNAAG